MLECMLCLYFGVVKHYCGWFAIVSEICGICSVGLAWNEDVRVVVGWRCGRVALFPGHEASGMVDGNDCGWWCSVRLLCM